MSRWRAGTTVVLALALSASCSPAQPTAAPGLSLVLGRPTAISVTVSILTDRTAEGCVGWGTESGRYSHATVPQRFLPGQVAEIVLGGLQPDTRYYYRLQADAVASEEHSFHTQRAPGRSFTFTITADSHLDAATSLPLYEQTLANARADGPDFHIDLGDTFMTDKHVTRDQAARQYLTQRHCFGLVAASAPLFVVLGNHDGEAGRWLDGTRGSLGVWANLTRKRYFPNPQPNGFYSGNQAADPHAGTLQDYYAWEWGDALFVVLDPYWYTPRQRGADDNWTRTLGDEQYRWLAATLAQSPARYKFVFIHQLVGGVGRDGRGGVEAASLYEWGGRDPDDTDSFAVRRPGWEAPIHELLVRNRVTAVFHGHDHLFAAQELDGVAYFAVPQPGRAGRENTRLAAEYGYRQGTILSSPGHLRVTVSPNEAVVEYIRSSLTTDEYAGLVNREVRHSGHLAPTAAAQP